MVLLIIIMMAISLAIFAAFVAIATIIVKKVWLSTKINSTYNTTKSNDYRTFQSSSNGKIYSATGWVWNEKTKLWERPDYIDSEMPQVKKVRNEPTYEEWKAAREAEQNKDNSTT